MIIHIICGARPNFIKAAPLYKALSQKYNPRIIHTGQHYDYNLSQIFFEELGLPKPFYSLGVGSGSQAYQIGKTMMAYDEIEKPDFVIVIGDVNATFACALVAKRKGVRVGHLESGLRSGDMQMPEESNRILTDRLADILWTPSIDANENLKKEGIEDHKIELVGNILADTYFNCQSLIDERMSYHDYNLKPKGYGVCTFHRPQNVDDQNKLLRIMDVLGTIDLPLIFPVHPRAKPKQMPKNIIPTSPLGYLSFMSLIKNSLFVISDSGGVQEETTLLNIPCFTLRDNTERPITVTQGTNKLVSIETLKEELNYPKQGKIPVLWDGKTGERIIETLDMYDLGSN